jgi:hypothetical protein
MCSFVFESLSITLRLLCQALIAREWKDSLLPWKLASRKIWQSEDSEDAPWQLSKIFWDVEKYTRCCVAIPRYSPRKLAVDRPVAPRVFGSPEPHRLVW